MTRTSKPRVLVLTSTLPAHATDHEPRFVLDLCRFLATRFDITILAPNHPGAIPNTVIDGVRVVRYRYAPFRSWETLAYPGAIMPKLRNRPWLLPLVPLLISGLRRRALRLAKEEHFDCIHCHWLVPQGIVGRNLKRRLGLPFVVTSHGGDVFSLRSRWAKILMSHILAGASAVTVVSAAIRDQIARDAVLARAQCRPVVIPMGVDTAKFDPALRDEEWVRNAGLARPLVAFAGRLVEKKGVEYLIDAMSSERLRSSGASLAIIGDGPLRRKLEQRANASGLHDRIRFLGPLPHTELARALASADIFCAPSVVEASGDREGLPTVICEAAASGLAVVATSVSGIPEVVVDGVTGRIVAEKDSIALSDALADLLADPGERARMSQAARRHIQSFAWTETARRFGDVYDSAMASTTGIRRNA